MKVSDLTVEQLKFIIEEVVDRKLAEYLGGQGIGGHGFGGQEEFPQDLPGLTEEMQAQIRARAAGIPDEETLKALGINLEEQQDANQT